MPTPYDIAASKLGTQQAAIADYLKTGGQNLDPNQLAWCAAFVNSSLQQAGIKGSGSNMARSLLNVGTPVDTPQKGDVAVFWRGSPGGQLGHTGFVDGIEPNGRIRLLGGDQSSAVTMTTMNPNQLLGYRRLGDPVAGAALQMGAPGAPGAPPAPSGVASMFGQASGETPAPPMQAPQELNLASMFLQQQAGRQQRQAQEQAAANQRRQALLGGSGVAGLYG